MIKILKWNLGYKTILWFEAQNIDWKLSDL